MSLCCFGGLLRLGDFATREGRDRGIYSLVRRVCEHTYIFMWLFYCRRPDIHNTGLEIVDTLGVICFSLAFPRSARKCSKPLSKHSSYPSLTRHHSNWESYSYFNEAHCEQLLKDVHFPLKERIPFSATKSYLTRERQCLLSFCGAIPIGSDEQEGDTL